MLGEGLKARRSPTHPFFAEVDVQFWGKGLVTKSLQYKVNRRTPDMLSFEDNSTEAGLARAALLRLMLRRRTISWSWQVLASEAVLCYETQSKIKLQNPTTPLTIKEEDLLHELFTGRVKEQDYIMKQIKDEVAIKVKLKRSV